MNKRIKNIFGAYLYCYLGLISLICVYNIFPNADKYINVLKSGISFSKIITLIPISMFMTSLIIFSIGSIVCFLKVLHIIFLYFKGWFVEDKPSPSYGNIKQARMRIDEEGYIDGGFIEFDNGQCIPLYISKVVAKYPKDENDNEVADGQD